MSVKDKKKKKHQGGRPSKYETHVKPRLAEIERWTDTMTEEQIARCCGVAPCSFIEYKKKYPELVEALKSGREKLVKELRSTLLKRARGFSYTEEKEIIDADGTVVRREVYKKAALPDVASMNLALKNYDANNWANDPQMLELKKEELKLQKAKFEEMKW